MVEKDTLTPLESGTEQNQTLRFYSRERRRSLAGLARMFRTHTFPPPTPVIDTDGSFPDRTRNITWQTVCRVTGTNPRGLIFELGGTGNGTAAWWGGTPGIIKFRAGPGTTNPTQLVIGEFSFAAPPVGGEFDLTFALRPGDASIRAWSNGTEIIRAQSTSGDEFPAGWAGSDDGSFASDPSGTLPTDVDFPAAPIGFEVIAPLSVYQGQIPRQFT